jgi:hypothetical protein
MSEFYKNSTLWVVDYRYQGRPRRSFRSFGPEVEVADLMRAELRELFGNKARLVGVRQATVEEEGQYLRGEEPKNVFCPTGRNL